MAKYKGRSVKLNKVQRGDVKKFKVFVRNTRTGRVQKVNFGQKGMSIGRRPKMSSMNKHKKRTWKAYNTQGH